MANTINTIYRHFLVAKDGASSPKVELETTPWPGASLNGTPSADFGVSVWVGTWSEDGGGQEGRENGHLELVRSAVPTHEHWLQYPPLRPEFHYLLGTLLVIIGTAGVLGNGLVLFVFTRFRRLRGPASSFIVNLAVADLCNSLLHSMAAASSFRRGWAFGRAGCIVYACGVGYFGLLSIVTLAAIAVERYMVITAKPLSGNWKMTQYGARKVCVVIWFYCALMSGPPLFGWSRYIPEGFLTSCSWDYLSRTPANRAYYFYLLSLGFVVPVGVIAYCYAFILAAIRAHGKEMAAVKGMMTGGSPPSMGNHTSGGTALSCRSPYYYHANHHSSPHSNCPGYRPGPRHASPNTSATPTTSHTGHHRTASHRSGARSSNAVRTAEVILTLVLLFLISWTPYTVVSMIGQFGDMERVTPWAATLPAIFAKASVIYNPIVYGLSHPHFRSSVRQYLSACTTAASAGQGTTASFMRRHSPQAPMKRKPEAAATIAEVASPEPSVASAPPAAVIVSDCEADPEAKRRMVAEILRSKHRRYRKHRPGSPSSRASRLHHVHFRYHSGEFLSEPDTHQVTLLIDRPHEGGNTVGACLANGGAVSGQGERRLTASHGGDDRERLNREERPGGRRSSCSRAVCVVYEGSPMCCMAGRDAAGATITVNRDPSTTSKSLWEMNSFF